MSIKRTQKELSELLCEGYIRQLCNIDIPLEIIGIIFMFYFNPLQFHKDKHGDNLHFVNDTTITKLSYGLRNWSVCPFGELMTKDNCSVFEIIFKWKAISDGTTLPSIIIGFISTLDFYDINMNHDLWNGFNFFGNKVQSKWDCAAIEIIASKYSDHGFTYYNNKINDIQALEHSGVIFEAGDVFKVQFDLIQKQLIIYHNMVKAPAVDVENMNEVIPIFAIYDVGDIIEVIEWNFLYND